MHANAALIVSDDEAVTRQVRNILRHGGFDEVLVKAGFGSGDRSRARPKAVLVVIAHPDRHATDLARLVQTAPSQAPVLVLSTCTDIEVKAMALDLGASDYICLPLDPEELLARIRATTRRLGVEAGKPTSLKIGEVEVDAVSGAARRAAGGIPLSRNESILLAALAEQVGEVVSYTTLMERLWPDSEERYIEYLRQVVRHLRDKIQSGRYAPPLIGNKAGFGYFLDRNALMYDRRAG
jgi:two-component system KDP operon response regulator KdpE